MSTPVFWTNVSSKHRPIFPSVWLFFPIMVQSVVHQNTLTNERKYAWLQIECWDDVRTAGGSDDFTAPATEQNTVFSCVKRWCQVKAMIPQHLSYQFYMWRINEDVRRKDGGMLESYSFPQKSSLWLMKSFWVVGNYGDIVPGKVLRHNLQVHPKIWLSLKPSI